MTVTNTGRIAITTRYFGPTNTRGPRIVATASGGRRLSCKCPVELEEFDLHAFAATELLRKLNMPEFHLIGGRARNDAFVFVLAGFEEAKQ